MCSYFSVNLVFCLFVVEFSVMQLVVFFCNNSLLQKLFCHRTRCRATVQCISKGKFWMDVSDKVIRQRGVQQVSYSVFVEVKIELFARYSDRKFLSLCW